MSHEVSHHGDEHKTAPPVFDNTGKLAGILIGVAAAIGGFLMYRFNPFLNDAASVQGRYIDDLFGITLGIGTAVFILVQGLLLYSIIRFHRQEGDDADGPPIHGNTRLETVWTAVPAAVIVLIAILSYQTLVAAERPAPDELVVEVTGLQYAWQFYYPEYDVTSSELHLPVDRTALLKLRSKDVVHSFWVPEFRIKKDVMPDRVTETRITPTEVGVYPVVCAELCGAAHADMRAQAVVESDGDFRQFIAAKGAAVAREEAAAASGDDPIAAGRAVFNANGCGACHVLDDAGTAGVVGPSLNGIGARAGGAVSGQSAEEYVRTAIVKPNDFLTEGYAGNIMPPTYSESIPAEDLDKLVEYLLAQQ
jgi:cytochrome c oxidase subunit 2